MKNFLFLISLLVNLSYADYFQHPESQEIINELVEVHNFDIGNKHYSHLLQKLL